LLPRWALLWVLIAILLLLVEMMVEIIKKNSFVIVLGQDICHPLGLSWQGP